MLVMLIRKRETRTDGVNDKTTRPGGPDGDIPDAYAVCIA